MNILGDVDNTTIKLKILKTLLSDTITDTDVVSLLQEEIDRKEQEDNEVETPEDVEQVEDFSKESNVKPPIDLDKELGINNNTASEETEESSDEIILPQPAALGQDFTNL